MQGIEPGLSDVPMQGIEPGLSDVPMQGIEPGTQQWEASEVNSQSLTIWKYFITPSNE